MFYADGWFSKINAKANNERAPGAGASGLSGPKSDIKAKVDEIVKSVSAYKIDTDLFHFHVQKFVFVII
jgi:hypothetical protein